MKVFLTIVFAVQIVLVAVLGVYSYRSWQDDRNPESQVRSSHNLSTENIEKTSNQGREKVAGLWGSGENTAEVSTSAAVANAQSAGKGNGALAVSGTSDLGFVTDLYDLPETTEPLPPELLEEYENVKRRFSPDSHLEIIKYGAEDFKASALRDKLNQVLTVKLYVIVRFNRPIDFPIIGQLKRHKFSPIYNFPLSEYIDKKMAVFYVRYHHLLPAVERLSSIADIYILKEYTARGFYQLGMKSLADHDNLSLDIKFPFSKTGRELLYKKNTVAGTDTFTESAASPLQSTVAVPMANGQIVTFYSDLRYRIKLEELLDTHIRVQGRDYDLKTYNEIMSKYYPDTHEKFTQFSEKIVTSEYMHSILRRVDTNASVAEIWKQITRILDREILYDWEKRDLFFSGNLTYYNIKNMYKTAKELGESRVGACTERTSLEVALLRELGISARAATRLYHIYTEIYIPDAGWTTTSLTLNEIPLDSSQDENMSYFVSWEPNHPIRLKWEGSLYPNIVY